MKKNGFSLSEILIFLLAMSVIVGITAPMFTKRKVQEKLDIPHGSFSCTYDGKSFVTSLTQGGVTSVVKNTTGCKFVPPVRARFFVITLVGAGAGGSTPIAERVEEKAKGSSSLNCSSGELTIANPLMSAFDDNKNDFMNSLLSGNTYAYTMYGGAGGWTRNYLRAAQWCGPYGVKSEGKCNEGGKPQGMEWLERGQPGDGGGLCKVTFNSSRPLKVGDRFSCVSGKNGADTPTDFLESEAGSGGVFRLARGGNSYSLVAYGGNPSVFAKRYAQEAPIDAPPTKILLENPSPDSLRPIARHGKNNTSGSLAHRGTCQVDSTFSKVATVVGGKQGQNLNHDHSECNTTVKYSKQTYKDISSLGLDIKNQSDLAIRKNYLSLLYRYGSDEKARVAKIDNKTVTDTPDDLTWDYTVKKEIKYTQAQGGGRGQVAIFERPTIPGLVNGVLTIGFSGINTIGNGGSSDSAGGVTKLNNGTLMAKGGTILKSNEQISALPYAQNTAERFNLQISGLDGQKSMFDGVATTIAAPKGGICNNVNAKPTDCAGAAAETVGAGGGGGGFYYHHAGAYGEAKVNNITKAKGSSLSIDKKIIGSGGKGASGGIYISW